MGRFPLGVCTCGQGCPEGSTWRAMIWPPTPNCTHVGGADWENPRPKATNRREQYLGCMDMFHDPTSDQAVRTGTQPPRATRPISAREIALASARGLLRWRE